MWPPARPCRTASAGTLRPSSATTSRARGPARLSATSTDVAFEGLTTLLSSSRAALNSGASADVRSPGQQCTSSWTVRRPAASGSADQVAQRRCQPDPVQDGRMQLGDRRAEQARGFVEGLPHPGTASSAPAPTSSRSCQAARTYCSSPSCRCSASTWRSRRSRLISSVRSGQKVRVVPDQAADRQQSYPTRESALGTQTASR